MGEKTLHAAHCHFHMCPHTPYEVQPLVSCILVLFFHITPSAALLLLVQTLQQKATTMLNISLYVRASVKEVHT